MKRLFVLLMSAAITMTLAACNPPAMMTEDKTFVEKAETEFSKTLEPIEHTKEEPLRSVYYKVFTSTDGEVFYKVQPVGETPLDVPMNETVIYNAEISAPSVEKVNVALSQDETFTQYRINLPFEADDAPRSFPETVYAESDME